MNQRLPENFSEHIHQLALGLEPIDALRRQRLAQRLEVRVEGVSPAVARLPGLRIARHESCVHALLRYPGLKSPLMVRFQDDTRRFVPRRLKVPVAPGTPTILRPAFFPGAAYDVTDRSTGLRGLVHRGGQPLRWARVEARLPAATPGSGTLVGRAHGDDRGEFLLLLWPAASTLGVLTPTLQVEVTVFGLKNPQIPATPSLPLEDPLWDVPEEEVPASGTDTVTPGEQLPKDYEATLTSRLTIPFTLGKLTSTNQPIVFS
ncbi:hypothetical protein [Hyalangium versicolor]|uniref:hypothetical protein n=1 Tax=Hyalangium versicolor TaxID=2861190 RepID=UPI001CC9204B|nr:hypothetical protein [Hyalangium versicolor]